MKLAVKTLLILTAILALALPVAQAQETQPTGYFIVGGQYDNDEGLSFDIGGGKSLAQDVYGLAQVCVGDEASLDPALAWFLVNKPKWKFAVLAGPGASWVGANDPLTYITGAGGAVAGYMPKSIGIFASARWKFDFDGSEYYRDGWRLWGGVAVKL